MAQSEILVATDFSPNSQRAFDFAVDLGRRVGAKITLVHVVEPIDKPDQADEESRLFHEQLLRQAQANLRAEFERLKEPVGDCLACLGSRVTTLITLAEERSPWMVVFGRQAQETRQAGIGLKFLVQSPAPVLSIA